MRYVRPLMMILLAPVLFVAGGAGASPGVTERVSLAPGGVQANDETFNASISADGRFVAFDSDASNLVPGDTNNATDVFVYDRQAGATERVSVASDGSQGDDASIDTVISADGRHVAFWGWATNLTPPDANGPGYPDVYVHDRLTGETTRVSVSSAGIQGNSGSFDPSISADGRFVAFESAATNFLPGDPNPPFDIYVHDRDTDADSIFDEAGEIATLKVSVDSSGNPGNHDSFGPPSISGNGRFVAFHSRATNLVPGPDVNGNFYDVFVRDRDTDADGVFDEPSATSTTRVSESSLGAQGFSDSTDPSMSADGRFVAFDSDASNLVPGDTNGAQDIFVRDLQADTTTRVSTDKDGTEANDSSFLPVITHDGRYVAFHSYASNLVAGDTNTCPSYPQPGTCPDVFVRDRDGDEDGLFDEPGGFSVTRVSVSSLGLQANDSSLVPSLSADARYVAYRSKASNLVPGDTNAASDAFVHDRLGTPPVLCVGWAVTIVGTAGSDILTGTGGPDVIHGLAGNDSIDGLAGNDVICGGAGNDTLTGGGGGDALLGQQGDDSLDGASGLDICHGGPHLTADTAINCEFTLGVP